MHLQSVRTDNIDCKKIWSWHITVNLFYTTSINSSINILIIEQQNLTRKHNYGPEGWQIINYCCMFIYAFEFGMPQYNGWEALVSVRFLQVTATSNNLVIFLRSGCTNSVHHVMMNFRDSEKFNSEMEEVSQPAYMWYPSYCWL